MKYISALVSGLLHISASWNGGSIFCPSLYIIRVCIISWRHFNSLSTITFFIVSDWLMMLGINLNNQLEQLFFPIFLGMLLALQCCWLALRLYMLTTDLCYEKLKFETILSKFKMAISGRAAQSLFVLISMHFYVESKYAKENLNFESFFFKYYKILACCLHLTSAWRG